MTYRRQARHLPHHRPVYVLVVDVLVLSGVVCIQVELPTVDIRRVHLE